MRLCAALILLALPLASTPAGAQPESKSFLCQGQELVRGNKGKVGEILIRAATDSTNGDKWDMQVQWKDSNTPVLGEGIYCGTEISAPATCRALPSGPNLPFRLTQTCGVGDFSTPRHISFDYVSTLLFDSSFTHGWFHCSLGHEKIYLHIALTGCREN